MTDRKRVAFSQLETGYQFPPAAYDLTPELIDSYLQATGEAHPLFLAEKIVPPTAVTAHALAALAEGIEIPPGTIHTAQEIESTRPVFVGDTITSQATVDAKRTRKNMEILTIGIAVSNQHGETVLKGKTTFLSSPQIDL